MIDSLSSSTIIDWAVTVALLTLLWVLVSVPAFVLLNGWRRIGTESPGDSARFFMRRLPGFQERYFAFRARIAAAYASLAGFSVRATIDRKHRRLRHELSRVRAAIDRRLQQITTASSSHGGGTLIDLLRSFSADVERALEFGTLEDGFVDNTVARSKARFAAGGAIFFALVISAANFGLLYLFFDEWSGGLRVPYLGIQLAVVLALIFPLVEATGGVIGEMLGNSSANRMIKIIGIGVILLGLVILGAFEFVIFYQLLGGLFQSLEAFPRDGVMHGLVSLVGSVLTALQALCGFVATHNLAILRELNAHISIRDQVADARTFVDSLEPRYDRIDRAAAAAIHSVDELAAQLRGRGEAELPIAGALAEQRDALRKAIDEVNPERWPNHVPASDTDRDTITAQACLLPFLVFAALAFFALAAGSVVARSGLVGVGGFAGGVLVALGGAAACFIAGAHLFDRTTLSYAAGDELRDSISPRDSAFRVAALVTLALASVGTIWLCIDVDGRLGAAEGLLLVAILFGLAIAGSYHDLAARGLLFVTAALFLVGVFALLMLGLGAWSIVLVVAVVVGATIHALLALAAWPMTWLFSLRRARQPRSVAAVA